MNIHEYQAKQLLAKHGVVVSAGDVCSSPEDARAIAAKRFAEGYKRVIVKSQIHAGGRGSGTFKNGLKGGVQFCSNPAEVYSRGQENARPGAGHQADRAGGPAGPQGAGRRRPVDSITSSSWRWCWTGPFPSR